MNEIHGREKLISKLIMTLSEEMQVYNELLLALREKQSSIIEGKVQDLKDALIKEQAIIRQTREKGEQRDEDFKAVAEAVGQDGQVRNISQLINVVESTYADRLTDIQGSLHKIANQVAIVNEENRYLLEYSIKFVRSAARELIKSSDQFPVYSADGADQVAASNSGIIEGTI